MRAFPFALLYSDDIQRAERWAVAHCALTHRDPIAQAACAALVVGMVHLLRDRPLSYVLSQMVGAACRYSPQTAAMMARALADVEDDVHPDETFDRLRAWAAHEAIAAAVYLLARHPDDVEAAILLGANTEGDSDSIATLAGALVGARVGVCRVPSAWIRDLERAAALVGLAEQAHALLRDRFD